MTDEKPQRSKVPPPIVPLMGSRAPAIIRPDPEPVNWNEWHHRVSPTAYLWEAVALAHDIEPSTLPVDWSDKNPFADCDVEIQSNIRIACDHAKNGKLKCVEPLKFATVHNEVDLSDFAEWWLALSLSPKLPSRFLRKSTAHPLDEGATSSAEDQLTLPPAPTPEVDPQNKPSKQEQRKKETQAMYETWHALALEAGYTEQGIKRTREKIAKKVASDPRAKHPRTGRPPDPSTVKRRLDRNFPGWAQKSWAQRPGTKKLPTTNS